MKKLIYIFVILLTFSIGVIAFYMRPVVTPVSLCEISQHAELYRFNTVRVKAYLYDIGKEEEDFDFSTISDYRKGCVTGATLSFSEKLKNDTTLKNLIEELRKKNNELREQDAQGNFVGSVNTGLFDAEVEVTGEIEEISSCFGMPFVIKAESIEQVSPIRFISSEEIRNFNDSK